jgi:hypothetical protein
MELSLPYLMLREVPSKEQRDKYAGKSNNRSSDLPCLNFLESSKDPNSSYWVTHKATASILIFGADEFSWTGYAFSSRGPTSPDDGEDCEDEHYTEEEDEMLDENMPVNDLFASDGLDHVVDCDHMIQDPRVYFLRCVAVRVEIACREWTYLVQMLERSARNWVSDQCVLHSSL